MPRALRSIVLPLLVLVAACGEDDPAGPEQSGDFLRARVNNVEWSTDALAAGSAAVRAAPGLYSMSGFQTGAGGYGLIFQLYNVRGPGTYPLGVGPQMVGGAATVSQAPSSGWSTPLNGVAGSITFTTLTETRMAGTFSFTATSLTGGGAALSVTNGEFSLPITALGAAGPIPENAGSTFAGTVGGAPFNASAASAILTTGQSPTLTVVGSNGERNVTISVANMTGPGTYTLSSTTPVRSIGVSGISGNALPTWNSQTGGSGTVTVTSVTAARIQGTFTATLGALSGGATGTLQVSGAFDMGRP